MAPYKAIASQMEPLPMLALRLPPEIEDRLEALSRLTGRSKSYYAREAILEHLDNLEDIYLAEQRLADLRAGRSDTVPLADVMKQHGLDD
ncbi:MAG TPA: DUF6290 family protein [Stellaceae bacterium]|nr:DUF6290 family protein [Stellaceae bacterium]